MAGTVTADGKALQSSNNPGPGPTDTNFGYVPPLAAGASAFPASVAPTVAAPHPASTPVAAPTHTTTTAVAMPDGSIEHIDNQGNLVSTDPAPKTPASNAYAAKQSETANGAAADKLASTTGSTTGANPFIATSDSQQNFENGVNDTLSKLAAGNSDQLNAHNDYLAQLDTEKAGLESRRAAEEASINKQFDQQVDTTKGAQANETGVENVMLQRSGGYLGMGASQTGALINLNEKHRVEIQTLESKRQDALQTADNAIDDKEFALADAKAKEAKDYANQIQTSRQQYLSDQLEIHKTLATDQANSVDLAAKQLQGLSSMSPDDIAKLDPATLTKIDQAYGVPGFAKSYLETTAAAAQAKTQSDVLDAQSKLLNLLQNIPQGQKLTFPDPSDPSGAGTTYTGLGKIGDISTFQETDNYGNTTIVSYNKATNTVTRQSAGRIGKTSAAVDSAGQTASRLNNIGQFISDPNNKILVPLDPTNANSPKFMTASDYVTLYQKYVKQYPGQGDEFTKQYPISTSVLPSQQKFGALGSLDQSSFSTTKGPQSTQ